MSKNKTYDRKLYRDNIWLDIELDELTVKIIDTPEFQRLDGLKQLAFADYVYRGAKHTRFLHSIGVYHVAKKIIDSAVENHKRLKIPLPNKQLSEKFLIEKGNEEEESSFADKMKTVKKIVSLAGLLHDITHIPYGHSLEDEISMYEKHDSITGLRLYDLLFDKRSEIFKVFTKRNEDWIPNFSNEELLQLIFVILKYKCTITSEEIKNFEDEIQKAKEKLAKEELKDKRKSEKSEMLEKLENWYKKFREEKVFHPFMSDIFGDTICADLLDYIIRDAQGTGLVLKYDESIFRFFFFGEDTNNNEIRLALSIYDKKNDERFDVLSQVLEILQMRHALAERVYYHKTKAAATSMLVSVLIEIQTDLPKDSNPYEDLNSVLNFTDSKFFYYLKEICKEKNKEQTVLNMIESRKLYKVGAIIPVRLAEKSNLNVKTKFVKPYHEDKNHKKKKELEDATTVENKVIIYCPPEHPQAKEIQTFIQTRNDKTRVAPLNQIYGDLTIKEHVKLLSREKYIQLWKFYLFLHPNDAESNIIVSKAITKFCKNVLKDDKIFEDLLNEKDFIKHQNYRPLNELRKELLNEWIEESDNKLASKIPKETLDLYSQDWTLKSMYPKIIHDMEQVVTNSTEWEQYEKSEFTDKRQYFDVFDMVWWRRFIERYKKSKNISEYKKLEIAVNTSDNIVKFRQELVSTAVTSRKSGDGDFRQALTESEKLIIDRIIKD